MFRKLTIVIFYSLGFTIFSCTSTQEKKNDESTEQKKDTTGNPQSTTIDFATLEKKVEQDSLNIDLRAMLAANYYSVGKLENAIHHFLIIYNLDNKNIIALSSLGNIYYDLQQDNNAIQFYERALALHPEDIDMKCDLATCYFRINKSKKAIEILHENIKADFNHKKSHYNLSQILKKNGKINEANEEMKIYESLASSTQ